jgi:hypothetical protein
MDPLAEFTRLECWDDAGKPYLKEVSSKNAVPLRVAHVLSMRVQESSRESQLSLLVVILVLEDLLHRCS